MNDISLTHLLQVAIRAAQAAGTHALENKQRRTETNETFDHDIKLVLDVECQKMAEQVIAFEFPDHGILGEEDVRLNKASDYEWVIDPIDGTMNFSHGFEYWCSSVAVRKNTKVLAGCVYAPEFNSCYTAHIEDVAKLNGRPLQISDTKRLQDAMVFSGISKHMNSSTEPHFERFRMLELETKKVRINGAAALDLCRLADGTCDGFFEAGLYLWDYAAAGLIAEQAGATLSIYPTQNDEHEATVLCSNKNLMDGLRAIYTECI
ncbi:MAG: hypothetical protein OES84_02890 [Kiritimatiellaceae bacterium]|nr:hypothetical protein [Kiritimatiellaceae bacterium]